MYLRTETLEPATRGDAEIIDITDELSALVHRHGLREGHVLVFAPGATAGLTTIEFEPGLREDFPALFERLAPRDIRYRHDDTWHDGNGHSHCRASLLGPSLTVPVVDGALTLGTWQQVIVVDFDNRPRRRKLVVQVWGLRED